MDSVNVTRFFTVCVPTFGNPRIEAYLQLPAAYRSLSRPSSAPDAKAFTLRSCSLELPIAIRFSSELSEFLSEHFYNIQGLLFLFAMKGFSLYTCSSSTFR